MMPVKEFNSLYKKGKKGNRKIKGAVKSVTSDGKKADSRLEKYLYDQLKKNDIKFNFQEKFVLQQGFKYGKETIRPITMVVDFAFANGELNDYEVIADTKGFQLADNKIKWKMLKRKFYKEIPFPGRLPEIHILKNKRECDTFVLYMLSRREKKRSETLTPISGTRL